MQIIILPPRILQLSCQKHLNIVLFSLKFSNLFFSEITFIFLVENINFFHLICNIFNHQYCRISMKNNFLKKKVFNLLYTNQIPGTTCPKVSQNGSKSPHVHANIPKSNKRLYESKWALHACISLSTVCNKTLLKLFTNLVK